MAQPIRSGGSCGEIEELGETIDDIVPGRGKPVVVDVDDDVYVAVGKGSSSIVALSWALMHAATKPSSFVYLVHVFPPVHHIPTPLGLLPKEQVSQAQVESYMHQERVKRQNMLHKLLDLCQSFEVQFDTCLIESDQIVKAVTELIPVLHIKRLIVGTSKSNLRKWKKGSCKAVQIQQKAPACCEVKIICAGRQVSAPDQSMSSSPASDNPHSDKNTDGETRNKKTKGTADCRCIPVKLL
ncbi:unnamed protein product [Musa acuminata subsp. burmannicoides]